MQLTHRYLLNGLSIEIGCDHPAVAAAVTRVLDYFGCSPLPVDASPPEARLSLSADEDVSWPASVHATRDHNGVEVAYERPHVFLRTRDATVRLLLSSGQGHGRLEPWTTDEEMIPLSFVNLVIHSVLLLIRRHGWFPLHAAALERHGRGVLLIGEGDSGKSTQAMMLVRQGWSYLSDDSILLRLAGDGLEVRPLRRSFGLDADAEALFPEIANHWRPFLTQEQKRRVDMTSLYPAQAADVCHPHLLLFPVIERRPRSELTPIGASEALMTVARQSPLFAIDAAVSRPHLETITRLVTTTPAYRLSAGRDLLEEPDALSHRLMALLTEPDRCRTSPGQAFGPSVSFC